MTVSRISKNKINNMDRVWTEVGYMKHFNFLSIEVNLLPVLLPGVTPACIRLSQFCCQNSNNIQE